MFFSDPHWLVLLLPLLLFIRAFRPLSGRFPWVRALVAILVVAALAGFHLRFPGREGAVIVVADRSLSMPVDAELRVVEMMGLLKDKMPAGARLGLVSFAGGAKVEMAPARSVFSGFYAELNRNASDLADGIQRALSLIPEESAARIILLSDGFYTGERPELAAHRAAQRGIPIDYRWLTRDMAVDLAITSLRVPELLNPGEAFLVTAGIYSPIEQTADIALFLSESQIASCNRDLQPGENSVVFSLSAPEASVLRFQLEVKGRGHDPVPENNRAAVISEVVGQKPILVIAETPVSSMYSLLDKAAIKAELLAPHQISWSMEFLTGYSAVIIENVAAERITTHGMQLLAAWVEHIGGGLMLTGGQNSFGTGGYYQSPLEDSLPVSLELRSQHRKLALAMMVVLDRSGSMAAPVRGDRTKMDLANIAAASSLDLLTPLDEFGLLAVDTQAHEVIPLQRVTDKPAMRDRILRVESQGGGIYVYDGISRATELLLGAEAKTRHIILFADASDSEKPGRYWELLDKATKAGLTLSVIGLGTENDPDANLLRKIAAAGKGRIFFTREPEELPRLFAQDTFVAARSTFIEEPTAVKTMPAVSHFVGAAMNISSTIGAYNLCYLRPEAIEALTTLDENKAPLLAAWQKGLGKVACYTGTISGPQAGNLLREADTARLFNGLLRWLALDDRRSFGDAVITQNTANGRWQLLAHLDPEREREFWDQEPEVDLLLSAPGREPSLVTLETHWETADTLSATYALRANETIVGTMRSGRLQKRLNPVCQIYSSEFSPAGFRDGNAELKNLATITGGREVIDLGQVWNSLPARMQVRNLASELIFLALLLFIFDVAERRTAFATLLLAKLKKTTRAETLKKPVAASVSLNAADAGIKPPVSAVTDKTPEPAAERSVHAPGPEKGVLNALKTARKQAEKRTRN